MWYVQLVAQPVGETGASLVGVDFSSVAIGQARKRAETRGLSKRATFLVGEAAATGLASGSLAGVMSVDAFWLFPDKPAVVAEGVRLLQPGGRFVFTTWECRITPPGWTPQLADYHAVLEQADLVVRPMRSHQTRSDASALSRRRTWRHGPIWLRRWATWLMAC